MTPVHKVQLGGNAYCGEPHRLGIRLTNVLRKVTCLGCVAKVKARRAEAKERFARETGG